LYLVIDLKGTVSLDCHLEIGEVKKDWVFDISVCPRGGRGFCFGVEGKIKGWSFSFFYWGS